MRNSAHTLAKLATPFGEQDALRLASVSHPEYVGRVASFFRQIGARGLLMHGTEGEAYANPLRCPQIHYIAGGEQRVLLERTLQDETPTLPAAKTRKPPRAGPSAASAGEVAIPQAIQRQIACCPVAAGESETLEQGLQRLHQA